VLRPLGGAGPTTAIVSADEQSFIDAVFADLERDDWRQALDARRGRRRGADGVLELSQPVHRRFHLLLVEAVCRQPGSPRLDPAKLDGMGMVVRRLGDGWQGWMTSGTSKIGWVNVIRDDLDPDPARRSWVRAGMPGRIDALVLARRMATPPAEDIAPLFAAPPELCDKLGRTILYGLIPVTSADRADAPEPAPDYASLPADEAKAIRDHLSEYLKARPGLSMPYPGVRLDPTWNPLARDPASGTDAARLNAFGLFLQQLMVELAAFEGGDAANDLLRLLDTIELPMHVDVHGTVTATMPAGQFVKAATPILIAGDANNGGGGFNPLTMPYAWPAIGAQLGDRLTAQALACMSQHYTTLAPGRPKYDGVAPLYAVRPFVLVRGHDNCPPRLIWGHYSEAFRILPWWDGDGPAARIPLPDPRDFRKMKPNVAFEVPNSLAGLLRGNPRDMLKNPPSPAGPGLGIMWICSFSIPIITICAFLVLGIFLSLFDLVFWWMAFVKICIPIPIPKPK
jgi:hypothetical protein